MERIKQDLKLLCNTPGAAGMSAIADTAAELLRQMAEDVCVDKMGNVIGYVYSKNPDAPTIMLEAHMDEIGFLVTHIDDSGFVYVNGAGGIDGRVLTAQEVNIYGDDVYSGVFCSTPPHLTDKDGELPKLSDRGIDVGMTAEEAKKHIPLGSRVTFAPHFCDLSDTVVCSKALDDRAGIAAILHCLRLLDASTIPVNVAVAFCVQEELGCRGSDPAARRIQPDAAIITDVSFAVTHDAQPHKCGKLGKGVMIGISPILSSVMSDKLFDLAEKKSIPYQYEVMGGGTGTDADHISGCLTGVPSSLLSIPQRYMHTPIETVDVRDVAAVGDLMAAYIYEGGIGL